MSLTLTSAARKDLADIAAIHVKSWQETYGGLVPQDYLDGLNIQNRLEKWQEGYKFVEEGVQGLLIARLKGNSIGFVSMGPARDEKFLRYGEIYAIYLLKAYWHQGIGYSLFRKAAEWLKSRNFDQAYLWVLDTNLSAIARYERWGGRTDKDSFKHPEIGGQPIKEIPVIFDNL